MTKQRRSGLEKLFKAMYAYDLPAVEKLPMASNPDSIQPIPIARIRFTEQETSDLVEFGRANQLSLNSVVVAGILLAEWELRNTPHIPIPYIYPVDLRYLLSPPVSLTGSTLPLGVATYLAEIGPETDLVVAAGGVVYLLGRPVRRRDSSSPRCTSTCNTREPRPGFPRSCCARTPVIHRLRTPPDMELDDFQSELYFPTRAPVDLYSCGTFAGRLFIEHHAHLPGREKPLEAIHSLLCSLLPKRTAGSWSDRPDAGRRRLRPRASTSSCTCDRLFRKPTAHYLARRGSTARIALAGRCSERLRAVRADAGPGRAGVAADHRHASRPSTLSAMAARARVVLTTVGPYTRYGLPLVAACAEAGTDYADLNGEPMFGRTSIDLHHKQAVDTGARIVLSCGFASIPSDINVYRLYRQALDDGAGELTDTTLVLRSFSQLGASGGTIASLLATMHSASSDAQARRVIDDPYTLTTDRGANGTRPTTGFPAAPGKRCRTRACRLLDRRIRRRRAQHSNHQI